MLLLAEEPKQMVAIKPAQQQQSADIRRENATRDTRPSSDQPQLPAPTNDDEDDKPDGELSFDFENLIILSPDFMAITNKFHA